MRDATDAGTATGVTTAVGTLLLLAAAMGTGFVPAAAAGGTFGDAAAGGAVGDAAPGGAAPGPSAGQSAELDCSYPLTVTDATGSEVTVEEAPERIVSLAPSAAQTLWEFDASGKVVGVNTNAAYLEGASDKEVVMDGRTVRTEVILGLEPDLVLAPNVVGNQTVADLRDNGLTVYRANDTTNFADLYAKTERIGRLSGECEAAAATVDDMRQRVSAIETAVSDEERPGALYTFYGYTTGANTFVDAIITTAGTANVAAEVGIDGFTTEPLNPEVVANNSERIEWLILNSNPASHPTGDVYNGTAAIQQNQTVVVNEDYLNQPAPRTVLALENITRAIHPAAYEEAQTALEATPTATATAESTSTDSPTPTDSPTATAEPTATAGAGTATSTPTVSPTPGDEPAATSEPTATGEPAAATTTGDGAGFTAATGVLALLAGALLVRRR